MIGLHYGDEDGYQSFLLALSFADGPPILLADLAVIVAEHGQQQARIAELEREVERLRGDLAKWMPQVCGDWTHETYGW